MLTQLTSFATLGLQSDRITVEVGCTLGEGNISIVGLGDTAVQESKQRVRMALRSSGYKLPTGRNVTSTWPRRISARPARATTCRSPLGS